MPDLENETPPEEESDNLAQLRQAADDGRKARADAELARRELAFAKAGIDTDKGVGKMALGQYAGEPTADAVKAWLDTEGITFPEANESSAPAVQLSDAERAQSRERAALATSSEPPTGEVPTPDPKAAAYQEFKKGRDEGMRLEDAGAGYFHTLFAAGYNGDKRAQFDPQEYAARAGEG